MGTGGQVAIGALLFVFGLLTLLGVLDWLVHLVGALTMVVGIVMVATGIMSGRRERL